MIGNDESKIAADHPGGIPWFARSIGVRLMLLVGLAVLAGLVAVMVMFSIYQERAILQQNERTMALMAEGISRGLQTMMLFDDANIARTYADYLKEIPGVIRSQVLRADGDEAFRDNRTILEVNKRIGLNEFVPRVEEKRESVLAMDDPSLLEVLNSRGAVARYEEKGERRLLTFIAPILNDDRCYRCHGEEQAIRGILRLTTSLEQVEKAIQESRWAALQVIGISLGVILLLTFLLVRRSVVARIRRMTEAMACVAAGDLTQHIPELGADELGQMAVSFNRMSDELLKSHEGLQREQEKLTTIILSAREGIVATNAQGEVVLINPAAERLLGKSSATMAREGFLHLVDDPEYLAAMLDRSSDKIPEIIVYKNRVLHLYAATIKTQNGRPIGSAALLRDVTEEKNLEKQLRDLSNTDALTGLGNRRRFDDLLQAEFNRAQRYRQNLALLLFDVDHFKQFNDRFGHGQGDRILQEIGLTMHSIFRNVDYCCRYGGEEFGVILPNTDYQSALIAAERLRKQVEEMTVDGLQVTISIGIAIYPSRGERQTELDLLLKQADQSLYAAKDRGRNQVCCLLAEQGKILG